MIITIKVLKLRLYLNVFNKGNMSKNMNTNEDRTSRYRRDSLILVGAVAWHWGDDWGWYIFPKVASIV